TEGHAPLRGQQGRCGGWVDQRTGVRPLPRANGTHRGVRGEHGREDRAGNEGGSGSEAGDGHRRGVSGDGADAHEGEEVTDATNKPTTPVGNYRGCMALSGTGCPSNATGGTDARSPSGISIFLQKLVAPIIANRYSNESTLIRFEK